MYKYVTDKTYLSLLRSTCGEMMQELCHVLKEEFDIGATPRLIGSGSRKLITQNGNESCDLDYDLEINKRYDYEDCRYIKESVRKSFNFVLHRHNWGDCSDSVHSLGTENRFFTKCTNKTPFSIDVGIVCRDEDGNYYRLIHNRNWARDEYYWNQARDSREVKKKCRYIYQKGKWEMVRDKYLELKNMYLRRGDRDHPSFICYIEAVNNVYDRIK